MCCRIECLELNEIALYKGPWPFKRLACSGCGHVMCPLCTHTDIIESGDSELQVMEQNKYKNFGGIKVTRYRGEPKAFEYCPACGLAHRAKAPGDHGKILGSTIIQFSQYLYDSCPCGYANKGDWPRMRINLTDDNRPTGQDRLATKEGLVRSLSQALSRKSRHREG